MGWFINRAGQSEGPFDESSVVDAIRKGTIDRRAQICAAGTEAWQPIEAHGAFAAAFAPGPKEKTKDRAAPGVRPVWSIIAAVSAVLAVVLLGVLVWRVIIAERTAEAWRSEERTRSAASLAELKTLNEPPKWVNAEEVHHNCYTNNSDVSCYFTNLKDFPVTTCMRGKLVQKEAQGVKLESIVLCTGKLAPSETKMVVGPWVGGFAKDICASKSYGTMVLDWSVCKFDTEAVDLPTLRRIAKAAK